ncbi:hypothetical protein RHMOL_Rhmol11G0163400 [Rhododendron molle]|uniref:Uncharacterized protein n=1 Tax=Rhododendron molle TaxID=49168 RepID=A0ACC0LT23_RHOML|nr:hypothetical protein RHMOL_Rhmol11G0163400 [Rhododendron molle]
MAIPQRRSREDLKQKQSKSDSKVFLPQQPIRFTQVGVQCPTRPVEPKALLSSALSVAAALTVVVIFLLEAFTVLLGLDLDEPGPF